MSEEWRRKKYYDPRVLVDVDRVLEPQFNDSVLCITGAQFELLRNLTQYLHRRSTFVTEYHDGYYLAPDNDDWDTLQAIVADLEETLMGCEEFTTLLQSVLECVCESSALAQQESYSGPALEPTIDKYITDQGLRIDDPYGDDTAAEAERCALAQLTYWQAYEFMTEYSAPLSKHLIDIVLPAAMGALAIMIGTTVLGIPAATLVLVLGYLIQVEVDGALANLVNEYESAEEDLICALYTGLATDYRAAETEAVAVIEEMDIGPIDKILLHTMCAPWLIALAKKAYDNATAWATSHVVAGYCDDCDKVVGSDWFALRIYEPDGDVFLDHSTPGAYWVDGACCGTIYGTSEICAVVYECVEGTGCDCKPMSISAGCAGLNLFPNSSHLLTAGTTYYHFKLFTHSKDEAVAALCPGATEFTDFYQRTGPGTWKCGYNLGWNCEGTRLMRVKYIVYEGAP